MPFLPLMSKHATYVESSQVFRSKPMRLCVRFPLFAVKLFLQNDPQPFQNKLKLV